MQNLKGVVELPQLLESVLCFLLRERGASSMARYILTFTTPGGNYVYDREVNALLSVDAEEFAAFRCK